MNQNIRKICFFNSDPKWGGGVTFYQDHVVGLQERGYEVVGVCSSGSLLSKWYILAKINQWTIDVGRLSFLNPLKIIRLVRFYRKAKIDAVLFTTSEDLKLGGIAAKIARVPRIIYRRGLAVPIKNRFTNRYIFKKVLTHIIANSEETKSTVLRHLSDHIAPDNIKVIYNGIDVAKHVETPHDPIWQPTGLNKNPIVIGNAGRLSNEKGQAQLISIAKELKARNHDFVILIAGSGNLEAELQTLIADSDLSDHIKMIGYVENIDRFMQSIDIFVLTSHWEGFGYVLVEAMLHKKPVVAYDTSSIPEVVNDKATGFLAKYKDLMDFTDKVEILINDKTLRDQMGNEGYQKAVAEYELQGQIDKFINYINT